MTNPEADIPPGAARIPLATYRLQFNRQFTFQQATEILDYLRELGVSDCYASPLFKAGPQSTHGYDICGFDQFSPNLGTGEAFESFAGRLKELGLGLLLDMVPNHMGADLSNAWWLDVLEKGQASPYATWFDIDWQPAKSDLHDQVLLPVLEDHYAKVLEAGKLRICAEAGRFVVAYYDRKFPLSPSTYPASPEELPALNGHSGQARSFDRLHALLQKQHYRLAYWRVGPEEINYRRFFDVTELVSLRMELAEVFAATHVLLLRLARKGQVTGLRIDHPDGLWDPKQYFERLQQAFDSGWSPSSADPQRLPLYIVAEKILTADEPLPPDWPVHGTTGYDFLNRLNGLFVNGAHVQEFNRIYEEFTGEPSDFTALVYHSKKRILQISLISELNALTHRLKQIATATRYGLDFTFGQLHTALEALIAAFPVYRTYITEATAAPSTTDREQIARALQAARRWNPQVETAVWGFLEHLLLLRPPEDLDEAGRKHCRRFVMRFQQLTGPVMAKGLEDTSFYNFNRLVSLNEVGGEPDKFGTDLREFHAYNQAKAKRWPHSLLASATHDTKRGEDVRARLNVLSEMPSEWREAVWRWQRLNADKKLPVDGQPAPHPNDEYLLYQTLVGAWLPATQRDEQRKSFRERITAYLLKGLKEAKARTSWTNPNLAYEAAVKRFIERLLASTSSNPFLDDFRAFQEKVAFFGWFNSLSQTLLKLTSPGVPDLYQGTELWDLSLVDPDNRRPVDYGERRRLLADLKLKLAKGSSTMHDLLAKLLTGIESGQIKLFLIAQALQFRRQNPDLFIQGEYVPLLAKGPKQEHVCAFARILGDQVSLTIVPRLIASLTNGTRCPPMGKRVWQETRLPLLPKGSGVNLRNVLTEETFSVRDSSQGLLLAEVLARFPVALLEEIR